MTTRWEVIKNSNRYFVWNPEAALRLRLDHRIIGTLVGCLPVDKPEQNIFYGLPLVLSAEEVALGLAEGFVKLLDGDKNYPLVAADDVEKHKKQREEALKKRASFVVVPTADVLVQANHPEAAGPAFGSAREALRFRVFSDLHKQGFTLTVDTKLQADFVVYRDDPLLVHAAFFVVVLEPNTSIEGLSMSRMSKLATSTKKDLVLASGDDTGLNYTTVKWEGVT